MTRIVGQKNRSPFVLDPLEALRAGRRVDAMLAGSGLPMQRGVFRATHRKMNEMDAARQQEAALRISSGMGKLETVRKNKMQKIQGSGSGSAQEPAPASAIRMARVVAVLEDGDSLGRYVATVIKPNHDHGWFQF